MQKDYFATPPQAVYRLGMLTRLLWPVFTDTQSPFMGHEETHDLRRKLTGIRDSMLRFSTTFPPVTYSEVSKHLDLAERWIVEVEGALETYASSGQPSDYDIALELACDRSHLAHVASQVALGCDQLEWGHWWAVGQRMGDCFTFLDHSTLSPALFGGLLGLEQAGKRIDLEVAKRAQAMRPDYLQRLMAGLADLAESVRRLPAHQAARIPLLREIHEAATKEPPAPADILLSRARHHEFSYGKLPTKDGNGNGELPEPSVRDPEATVDPQAIHTLLFIIDDQIQRGLVGNEVDWVAPPDPAETAPAPAAESQQATAAKARPSWNDHDGKLTFGGRVILKLERGAPRLRQVLRALDAEAWAPSVSNPIEADAYVDAGQVLKDAVRYLNANMVSPGVMRFTVGAGRTSVGWEIVEGRERSGAAKKRTKAKRRDEALQAKSPTKANQRGGSAEKRASNGADRNGSRRSRSRG